MVVVDLSESLDELPEIDPRPLQPTLGEATLRQAYVLLERIDAQLPLPQLPERLPTPPPVRGPDVDWEQLEDG